MYISRAKANDTHDTLEKQRSSESSNFSVGCQQCNFFHTFGNITAEHSYRKKNLVKMLHLTVTVYTDTVCLSAKNGTDIFSHFVLRIKSHHLSFSKNKYIKPLTILSLSTVEILAFCKQH